MLHTHEMGAHAVLVMHNLTVAEAFFRGIRAVLQLSNDGATDFEREVRRFCQVHSRDTWDILEEAHRSWLRVDKERGKGRLSREVGETKPNNAS